jgi:peptide/nickel transport system permease protein
MGLRSYITKRVISSLILLFFVITLNFFIFMVMPGDPTDLFLNPVKIGSPAAREQARQQLRNLWGIGDPIYVQYSKYVVHMLTFDFGESIITRLPVADDLMFRMPYTVLLMGGSTVLAIILGILLGALAAHKRGGKFDSASVISSLIVYSLPTFWLGLIFLLIFYVELGIFPNAGAFPREWALNWPNPMTIATPPSTAQTMTIAFSINAGEAIRLVSGFMWHATLPLLTLTIFQYGGFLLLTRATMIEALTEDYILTAKAKGVKERTILFRHALKNASLPLITSIALSFGFMLSGAIITETVFTWPGLGTWIWSAISMKDFPVLQASFYIISLCVILANFVSDLLYGVVDPRIKYG